MATFFVFCTNEYIRNDTGELEKTTRMIWFCFFFTTEKVMFECGLLRRGEDGD